MWHDGSDSLAVGASYGEDMSDQTWISTQDHHMQFKLVPLREKQQMLLMLVGVQNGIEQKRLRYYSSSTASSR